MQFITTDQRIAVENFDLGLIYTVTFTDGRYFLGACIGKGADFVMFQRTEPELIYCLNMVIAADVASIEPLPENIGQILEYTGSVPTTIKTDGTSVDELSSNGKLIQRVDTDGSVLPNPIISYIDTPTIPTTDGLNIFDIDTTVKPSEVYLKYFSPLL